MSDDYDYLKTINGIAKPSIPKHVFVGKYLPLVFNKDPKVFNMYWLNDVSKNIFLEVDVIDTDGEVVFTVPPLKASHDTSLTSDLNMIANHAEAVGGVHKLRSEALLNKELPSRTDWSTDRNVEHEARWREILIACGYEDELGETTEAIEKAMGSPTTKASGFIYDPNDDDW